MSGRRTSSRSTVGEGDACGSAAIFSIKYFTDPSVTRHRVGLAGPSNETACTVAPAPSVMPWFWKMVRHWLDTLTDVVLVGRKAAAENPVSENRVLTPGMLNSSST